MKLHNGQSRHLSFTTLEKLWSNGAPLELTISGVPTCRLRLDPENSVLALMTNYQTPEPEVAKLKNVEFRATADGGQDMAELRVYVAGDVYGAYGLLATIADHLQIENMPLAVAVTSSISEHLSVFAPRTAFTLEQEIGLYGELSFIEYLTQAIGPEAALSSWQGPHSEEHDFTLIGLHIEVKTTIAERRVHFIHGLNQLMPLHGTPLNLLSIQLTRSAPNVGRTLPELIAVIRTLVEGHAPKIDKMLSDYGWRLEDTDLYPTCWTLRSEPLFYDINEEFPALTSQQLSSVVPNFGLISDVSYRVDFTNLSPAYPPDPIGNFANPWKS